MTVYDEFEPSGTAEQPPRLPLTDIGPDGDIRYPVDLYNSWVDEEPFRHP